MTIIEVENQPIKVFYRSSISKPLIIPQKTNNSSLRAELKTDVTLGIP